MANGLTSSKTRKMTFPLLAEDYIILVADGLHKKQIEKTFGVVEGRMVCA